MKKLLLLTTLLLPSFIVSCGDDDEPKVKKTTYEDYNKQAEEAFNSCPMGSEVPYRSAVLELKGNINTYEGYKEVDLRSVYAYIGFTKQFRLQKTNSPEGVTYGNMPDTVDRPDLAKTPINYYAESTVNMAAHHYPDLTNNSEYKMGYYASKEGFKYVQECSRGTVTMVFNKYARLIKGKAVPKGNDPEKYECTVTLSDKNVTEIE